MKEIIKIEINDNQEPIVSGRELYQFLEVKTPYTQWFERMIEYGFIEDIDFCLHSQKSESSNITGFKVIQDHLLKMDMAKEIAMIQRSNKGKQARQYFIQIEKDYNSPEKIMARALKIAENTIKMLKIQNNEKEQLLTEQKPKVLFADAVASSHTSILIGDLAKILKQNGVQTGQKRLFEELRNKGFLMKEGSSKNMPTQKSMELKLFEVKESTISNPDGSITINRTTKVTGKGQQYFINMFLNR